MKHYIISLLLGLWLIALVSPVDLAFAENDNTTMCAGCSKEGDKPLLAVSIRPLAMLVRELVSNDMDVHQLIDAGQDPHHGALQPSRRLLLDQADLVVWVGPGLESFLARPLASFAAERQVVWLPESASSGHGYHHGNGQDPHPWLDPEKTRAFVRHLSEVLMSRYPERAEQIAARLAAQEKRLQQLGTEVLQRLAPLRDRAFVAEHAAYGPFVNFVGLKEAGSLSDSSGIHQGARNLQSLKAKSDIACVAVEQAPGTRLAIQLAAALTVPVVEIDPFGLRLPEDAGYSDLIDGVAAGFERCLVGGAASPE